MLSALNLLDTRVGDVVLNAAQLAAIAQGGDQVNKWLALTDAKSDAGIPLAVAAAAGAFGVSRTAGTSLFLIGEATSGNAKTDKAMWEFNLPTSYKPATDIPIVVNCNYAGVGTVTGASCTMTVQAYTEANGVETALTVSAAQQIPSTATNLTFTLTGTNLTPGQRIVIELVMLITSASGANTGQVNRLSIKTP